MTNNLSFAKITDIFIPKLRSVIVSQNHHLNKMLDVHPLYLESSLTSRDGRNTGDMTMLMMK